MDLTCFKAYDVRGELGVNIDAEICYRIGRSSAQTLNAKSIVVGRDARETSPESADAVSRGIMDAGADVLDIGLSGTEEMYWATSEFAACGGIEVTASHNPINYNGLKMVQAGSKPLILPLNFLRFENWPRKMSLQRHLQKGRIKISHQRLNRPT